MNKIIWRIITGLSIVLALTVILLFSCFTLLDTTPYRQTDFYQKQLRELSNYRKAINNHQIQVGDSLQVGWAKVNLLPPFTTPISIDAHRGGKHFEGVHDSIYIRAFVFKNGATKVAFISADLLIVPPVVTNMFDTLLQAQGFTNNNIFFTATHTHTSIGGWHPSYVGEIFAGKYDERVPLHIAGCISKAILTAEADCAPATVGYGQFPTSKLVFNRLVRDSGTVDSLLRIVKIEKQTGKKAAIITFSAHATVFHEDLMKLSADWPGLMITELEKGGKVDFAGFSAGAVGSHGPYEVTQNQEEEAKYLATGVAKAFTENFDSIMTQPAVLDMNRLQLYLRQPNLRLRDRIVLRPWLFKRLFGDEKVYITHLTLGNISFAGLPCDFSGELLAPLDSAVQKHGNHLVITSFNGGYIGYITRDEWYGLNTYETRTMGWFGPGNGSYISEVLAELIGP